MQPWYSYLADEVYSVPDFPLVDMPIRYNQGEVILIIARNVSSSEEEGREYLFTDDRQILDEMQNKFFVVTFPPDQGTTPDSMVCVYQDGTLIKQVVFVETPDINMDYGLTRMSKEEAEGRIGQELPPAF